MADEAPVMPVLSMRFRVSRNSGISGGKGLSKTQEYVALTDDNGSSISLTIKEPDLFDILLPGLEFTVDFTPAMPEV